MENNSEKEAQYLFELLKKRFKEKSIKLFHHTYKRKYVEGTILRDYQFIDHIVEDQCKMERYTSDIFGKENEGLNRDGWEFTIVSKSKIGQTNVAKYTTWFNNRHKNYGSLIHEEGWNCTPYLNINNLGIEFSIPSKTLIEKWKEPHLLLKK